MLYTKLIKIFFPLDKFSLKITFSKFLLFIEHEFSIYFLAIYLFLQLSLIYVKNVSELVRGGKTKL